MKNSTTSFENRIHSSSLRPYSYYLNVMPDYHANIPMHWHEEFEISICLGGCGDYICEDEKFRVGKGDILFIPSNRLHSFYPDTSQKAIFDTLVFNPSMLGIDQNDRSTKEIVRPLVEGKSLVPFHIFKNTKYYNDFKLIIDVIFENAKTGDIASDIILKGKLLELIYIFYEKGEIKKDESLEKSYSSLIRPSIEYLSENYKENISIKNLAQICCLSESYFMYCFKMAVGVSAIDYLTQLRIKEACEKLSYTDISVSDIAYDCGFNNISNFNRLFKKIKKCTPNEFRKNTKPLRPAPDPLLLL